MPIAAPPLAPTEWPPQVDRSKIPPSEHAALQHAVSLLLALAQFERRFRTSLLLFESCTQWGSPIIDEQVQDTLSGWKGMAARDGALSIFHFGRTLMALRKSLQSCPTLNAAIDHRLLRIARKSFKATFPRCDDIRHVVAHVADFAATLADKEEHSLKGPWKIQAGRVTVEHRDIGALTQMSGNLYDNVYVVTFEGEVLRYEIGQTTTNRLSAIKRHIYRSIRADMITKPSS